MDRGLAIVALILVVFLGCIEAEELVSDYSTVNVHDMVMHPDAYAGEENILSVFPVTNPAYVTTGFKYQIQTEDEMGNAYHLHVDYEHFYCYKCRITGKVLGYQTCTCQIQRSGLQAGEEEWHDLFEGAPLRVEWCEIEPNKRCKPDEPYADGGYYFNVTKVTDLPCP